MAGGCGRQDTAAVLPQVLPACRLDQAVNGVVGVLGARLHPLVAKEDGLLGVILDMGDVARRIVGVMQVLQYALVR